MPLQQADMVFPRVFHRCALLVVALALCTGSPLAAQNPIKRFFKGLDQNLRDWPEEVERSRYARDQIDMRPVQRSEDNRRLRQAQQLAEQQRWHEVVEILQYLLDSESDTFVLNEHREHLSVHDEAERIFAGLPADARRNYENRYGAVARQMLEQARATQDDDLLIDLATRFRFTPAGQQALEELSQIWQDRGNDGAAAAALLRLADTSAIPDQQIRCLRRASHLFSRAGQPEAARRTIEKLSSGSEVSPEETDLSPAPTGGETARQFVVGPRTEHADSLSTPKLVPDWSAPMFDRYAIRERMDSLNQDQRQQGKSLLPAVRPLVVGDRIACSTIRGLALYDLASGRELWNQRVRPSIEELILSTSDSEPPRRFRASWQFYADSLFEHRQLTGLLYLNEVFGNLSSDGTHLYATQSNSEMLLLSPAYSWQMNEEAGDEANLRNSNELVARDLETGRIRWRVGGTRIEKQFSRPLSGTFFLGPPVPYDGDLYVIGERDGDVTLFCLASDSGEERWSQPLATAGRTIGEDIIRRGWPCQPVFSGGVIICPTGCGWLVGVDQTTRRLKWTFRYTPHITSQRQYQMNPPHVVQDLNRRWPYAPPLVHGERVLIAPQEMPDEFGTTQPALFCVDVQTGAKLWEQPKGDSLALAGLWNGMAIVIGSQNVSARNLGGQGEVAWSVSLPNAPSGRPVIVNDTLFVPAEQGELITVDLRQAALREVSRWSPGTSNLGNLAFAGGKLLALSPTELICFSTGEGGSDSDGGIQRLQQARLLLTNDRPGEALALLSEISSSPTGSPLAEELSAMEWDCRAALIRHDPAQTDEQLARLQSLAQTPERKRTLRRLMIDDRLRRHDWLAALSDCLKLLNEAPEDRVEEGERTIRIDGWVGSRLRTLYAQLTPEEQLQFEREVRAQSGEAAPLLFRDRLARALMFHPLGQRLELDLARQARSEGELTNAIIRYQRAQHSPDPAVSQSALFELGTLLMEAGRPRAALPIWKRLTQLTSISPEDAQRFAIGLRGAEQAVAALTAGQRGVGDRWEVVRRGIVNDGEEHPVIETHGDGLLGQDAIRFSSDEAHQRVILEDRISGEFLGSFPLHSLPALEHNSTVGIRLQGPLAYCVHRGVVHAISLPEQRVCWTWSPELKGLAATRLSAVTTRSHFGLQRVSAFLATHRLGSAWRNQTGLLTTVSDSIALVFCNEWVALDPLTGDVLWTDRPTSQRALAYAVGPDELVTGTGDFQLRSALDGSLRSDEKLERQFGYTLQIDSRQLVTIDQEGTPTPGDWHIRGINRSDVELWRVPVPRESLLGRPNDRTLVIVTPGAGVQVVDCVLGVARPARDISSESLDPEFQYSLVADAERMYLLVDEGKSWNSYSISSASIPVSGTVYALDRGGRLLWRREVDGISTTGDSGTSRGRANPWRLYLLVEDFDDNPLLLFAGIRSDRNTLLYRMRIVALDKRSGQPVVEWEEATEARGIRSLSVDLSERSVEIHTYYDQFRLRTVGPPSAAAEPSP